MTEEAIRLQKFISRAGRASRREAERLMSEGRVSVNGVTSTEMGVRVVPGVDRVAVDGKPVEWVTAHRWIAFHKPRGVTTTRSDPHAERTVYDVLPEEMSALRYIGRLDQDTEGLLLMTNDGDTAHALQHPSGEVEREYEVLLGGQVGTPAIQALLRGVELEDGRAKAKSVRVTGGDTRHTILRLVITEGRKREVRRMMRAIDHVVQRLTRVRFGPIRLGGLAPGGWRDLTEDERKALARVAGADT